MKIGIVGSGLVGSTSAYAMVMRGIGRQIVLVDKNKQRAEAEAKDILHAVPFTNPLTVRSGDYSELSGSKVVVLSAGVSQRPGETRLELLKRNALVFKDVVPQVLRAAPGAVLVVATNPVDIMTHLVAKYASGEGSSASRIIGTGTTLDTARFRSLIGGYVGVDPHHVHGYVVGEHGDSEVLTWSLATVASMHLEEFCLRRGIGLDDSLRDSIDRQVRNVAYEIIEGKGATYYGIGSAVAKIVDAVLHDQRTILTVSAPTPEVSGVEDVSVSLPRLVGGDGILETFVLPLDKKEEKALRRSALIIREALDELERFV